MNYSFLNKSKLTIALSTILLITSCALKPITSEYNFITTDLEKVELGNGKILIYNGANILHKIDNTGRLNVWIDNKPLGQIRPSEYVIINLKKGQYQFKALHLDVVNMKSLHYVDIDKKTEIIKIKPNVTSNKLEITNELPKNFGKFKYAEKR